MVEVLGDFVEILVSAITDLGTGIAAGVLISPVNYFSKSTQQPAVEGLSMFGGLIAIFAGLALAVSITTKVYMWVTSLGN